MTSPPAATLVLLGSRGVGKTSLLNSLLQRPFDPSCPSTTSHAFIDATLPSLHLQAWDTTTSDQHQSSIDLLYNDSTIALLCSTSASIASLSATLDKLKRTRCQIYLVATQSDLPSESSFADQIGKIATEHAAKSFVTSAKAGAGIPELLQAISADSKPLNFDVVFIGHCTKDEITIKGTTSYLPGGGVYFGAMSAGWALKRFASQTPARMRVLTVGNPADYIRIHEEVASCGCSLQLLGSESTTTFLHSFRDDNPDQRVSSVGGVGRSFAWSDIEGVRAKLFYVNPLFFGEVDPALFATMKQNCDLLFVDAQGLIRHRDGAKIYHEKPADLGATVRGVDILKVDAEEATSLTGIENTEEACAELMKLGLKYLICTQKAGVAVYTGGIKTWAEFGKWTLEGRTGRGDTVSAAFLVLHFVVGLDIGKALKSAAEGCSNKMMHPGAAVEADFSQLA